MNENLWYAIMMDNEDDDWGTGCRSLEEAKKRIEELKASGCEEAYIAVINEITGNPVCIEEIR